MKFFLNSSTRAHLRGLESEFGESSNAIRVELNRFENAGLLQSLKEGNRKVFQANKTHPLYKDIHSIVLKETGISNVIDKVVHRVGKLDSVYLTGDFANGKNSPVIELIIVGLDIDKEYLARKVVQAEELVGRRVLYTVLEPNESLDIMAKMSPTELLPLWSTKEDE